MQLQSDHPGVKDYFDDVRVFELPATATLNVNVFDEGGFSPASVHGAVRLTDIPVKIYALNGTLVDSGITNSTGSVSFNLPVGTYNMTYGGTMITPYDSGIWWAISSKIVDVQNDPTNIDVHAIRIIFHHYTGGNNFELNYIDLNTTTANHENSIIAAPGQQINAEFSWWELETANVPVWYVSVFGSWNPTSTLGNLASGTASPSSHNLHTVPLTFTAPTTSGTHEVRLNGVEDYDWSNSYYTSFHYQPSLGRDTCNDLISKNQIGPYGIGTIIVTGQPSQLSVSINPLSASLNVGQPVTFTSNVSGGTIPYSYQWYLNGAPVSGATNAIWTFTPTSSGSYTVYLIVIDANSNTAQSDTAHINVIPLVGGYSLPTTTFTTTLLAHYLAWTSIIAVGLATVKHKTKRRIERK
jgi:hypothetical protein